MYRFSPFMLLIALLVQIPTADAQTALPTSEKLIVGTKVAPPFVIKKADGSFTGISIELWQAVADKLQLDYEFRESDISGLLDHLDSNAFDASVAALTVTAKREEKVDFSHPFYTTGLAIAVPQESRGGWRIIKRFFSWEFFTALAALAGLLFVVGVCVWLFERRTNAEEFGGSTARGLGAGFWWAAVTMTTVGYGDKSPRTFGGRIVALVWMFAAIIIISSFTAAIATALTVGQLETKVEGIEDLPQVRVATVAESASSEFLEKRHLRFIAESDLSVALTALASGKVDAVVYDAPILKYLANQEYPRRTQVLAKVFDRQDYAVALPEGSPLREPMNQAILEFINSDQWQEILRRYLGE